MQIQHWRCLTHLARQSRIGLNGGIAYTISKDGYLSRQQRRVYSDQAASSSSKQTLDDTSQPIWKEIRNPFAANKEPSDSTINSNDQQIPLGTLISVLNDTETPNLDRVGAYEDLMSRQQDRIESISDEGIRLLSEEAIQQGYTHTLSTILRDLCRNRFGLQRDPLRKSEILTFILSKFKTSFEESTAEAGRKSTFEVQVDHFRRACTKNMESACRMLNEDAVLLKQKGQDSNLFQDIEPETAIYLSTSIALMDVDFEMLPLLSALLDIVLAHPTSSFKEVSDMGIFADTLARYLLHPNAQRTFDESTERGALFYATKIVDLVDQHVSMHGMSTSLKSAFFSVTRLDRLMDRCNLSSQDRNSIQFVLFARSTVASILLQSGAYSACMNILYEMSNDLNSIFMSTPASEVTILDLELILLQGFRYLLRSATSQIQKATYDSKIVSRLLPILIRHALLDNQSDDLLWVRDFGSRLVDSGEVQEFAQVVQQTVNELNSVKEGNTAGFDVLAMFGGQLIISAIEQISHRRNRVSFHSFLQSLQIVQDRQKTIGDARIDLVFLDSLRTRLIIACMNGGLRDTSVELYLRWREVRVEEPITFALVKSKLSSFENMNEANKDETEAEQRNDGAPYTVSSSSHCAAFIVNSITRRGMKRWHKKANERLSSSSEEELIPRKMNLVYDVLISFMMSKRREKWNEKDIINVSQMLFRLGHSNEAQKCLSSIAQENAKYPEDVITTLAHGIAESNVEEGIEFLEQRAEAEDSAKLITDKVIGPVFNLAMFEGKIELVQRLLRLSEQAGVTESLAMRSKNVLAMSAYDKEGTGFKNQFDISREDEVKSSNESNVSIDNIFDDVRVTQQWLYSMLQRGLLSTDPDTINKMIIGCVTRAERIRKTQVNAGEAKRGDAIADRMRRLASTLLQYSAKELQSVDLESTMLVLSSFHFSAGHRAKGGIRAYQQQKMNELDSIVSAIRWAVEFRISPKFDAFVNGDEKKEILVKKTKSNLLESDALINILPPMAFRALLSAYSRLNDNLGVASVIQWVRDECGMSLEELSEGWKGTNYTKYVKRKVYLSSERGALDNPNRTLKWISGQESVPLIKSWWYEPKQKENEIA
ncbi:uncharacterized protein FA14DRAFT_180427 [Meira miltonrushii]|uniref:Uncharacterized protein n=1 Tax=Meira miltonrushii TaxID=1280837 RepID=A0A316VCS3_9BASI|nr:uncharacterized protein FA14DRAFT_180427 [Meira miltonrushii]PWN33791.1 hypothetical protein FA14DRAFT_180427 [Meira miltonrushii]